MLGAWLLALSLLVRMPGLQGPAASRPEHLEAAPVVVVRLQGPLETAWASILRRAASLARERSAVALILDLDTPGGEVELMRQLGQQLDELGREVETVVFIHFQAISAGAFLAMSCREIAMAPGAAMGAATPLMVGPGGVTSPMGMDEGAREKFLAAYRAEFRSWAERHGRDGRVAEAFVDPDVELRRVRVAGELRLVDGREFDQLLEQGDTPVTVEVLCPAGQLLALTPEEARDLGWCDRITDSLESLLDARGWQGHPLLRVEPTWSEALVSFIGSRSWLLLLAAGFCLIVAFNMPGLGAPEAMAVLFFAIFLFHGYLVGLAEWTEMLLVVLGLGLLAVELFLTPGVLVPGIAGVLCLAAGLVLSMQDFVLPEGSIQMETFQDNLLVLLGMAAFLPVVGVLAVNRLLHTRVGSRLVNLPSPGFAGTVARVAGASGEPETVAVAAGARGVALTPLRPAGRVEVDGVPFDALSGAGFLEPGTPVVVVGQRGGSLVVKPATAGEEDR